jgi:hypothetical protein
MEKYIQEEDLTVFGNRVETFPLGIKEAFDSLVKVFGPNRDYYGVSWFAEDGRVIYYSAVSEAFKDEAKKYDHEQLTLPKGEYLTAAIYNWMSKTDCIKDVFHQLMAGTNPTINSPCIEWYKSDDEMLCMVKIKR